MGWLIALAILVLLGCLPLGVRGIYAMSGATVDLLIGPVKMRLYPRENKQKPKKQNEEKKAAATTQKSATEKEEDKGGSFTDFLPLIKVLTDFLGDFRRKLRC